METDTDNLEAGREFEIEVQVWASATSPVDTGQVYLDFDTDKLEAISLTAGEGLEYQLQAITDNTQGRIGFAAGTLGGAATMPFILCTVRFRSKAVTDGVATSINYAPLIPPRQTKVVNRGVDITGELRGLTVTVH